MSKWTVQMEIRAYQEVEVEAENAMEAQEAAQEMADLYECCPDFEVEILDSWCEDEPDEDEEPTEDELNDSEEDDFCDSYMCGKTDCYSCGCDACPHYGCW